MRPPTEQWRAAVAAWLRSASAHVAAHHFWYECAAITVSLLFASVMVGRSALQRAALLEARAAELEGVEQTVAGWESRLTAPTAAESTLWRDSETALRRLARGSTDALSAASNVARRADEVGIYDLQIRMLSPDSVGALPPLTGGDWLVEAGRSAVEVRFLGDWSSVINFVGSLPPHVAVGALLVEEAADGLAVRATLLTREVIPR